MNNLDFDDTDGNGAKSIWSESCPDGGCQTAISVNGSNADKVGCDPIGTTTPFSATFEGNTHAISNLYIDQPTTNSVGLFGSIGSGAELRNADVEEDSVAGFVRVGALAGWNEGMISMCSETGSVSGSSCGWSSRRKW